MKKLLALLTFSALLGIANSANAENVKVVYHISEGIPQATRAIGNIRNHLAADPSVKIVVVAHGPGIDFLLENAETTNGQKFSGAIGELASKGVEFLVCNNTLEARKIPKEDVVLEAKIVPSGVAEIATLQAKQKFVYLKP
jgi:intracellular sulfur oxidation DsrE/DsrF family protein